MKTNIRRTRENKEKIIRQGEKWKDEEKKWKTRRIRLSQGKQREDKNNIGKKRENRGIKIEQVDEKEIKEKKGEQGEDS